MASIPGLSSTSSATTALNSRQKWHPKTLSPTIPFLRRLPLQSIAREVSADLSSPSPITNQIKTVPSKDPIDLWHRYVDWLYQHKELGFYLDVSRIGFSDEFLQQMEPRMQRAFEAMRELEKGAIVNPDEGRMVGHYWLRNPKMAPNAFLMQQIENVRVLRWEEEREIAEIQYGYAKTKSNFLSLSIYLLQYFPTKDR